MHIRLSVVEIFNSIQGEGVNLGKPATFIRLAGCPLRCAYCDTKYSWDVAAGKALAPEEVLAEVEALGPRRHLVVTGGEPMIWAGRGLEELLCGLRKFGEVEVETSGAYAPTQGVDRCVDYYDVSPKLSNAGVRRYALSGFYPRSEKAWFKFVVGSRADVDEALRLIEAAGIPRDRALLMPLSQSPEEQRAVLAEIWDYASSLGLRITPRLHIFVWGAERGR